VVPPSVVVFFIYPVATREGKRKKRKAGTKE
jgi:hypothetical protein